MIIIAKLALFKVLFIARNIVLVIYVTSEYKKAELWHLNFLFLVTSVFELKPAQVDKSFRGTVACVGNPLLREEQVLSRFKNCDC